MESHKILKDQPHSVKISINAKGLYSGECKCYADTPEDALKITLELSNKLNEIIKVQNKI